MAKPIVRTLLHAQYEPDATCESCVWTRSGSMARALAKGHTLESGHITRVETVTISRYGREDR